MKKHLILSVLITGLAVQPAQAAWYTNITSAFSALSTNHRWQAGLAGAAAIGITAVAAIKIKKAYTQTASIETIAPVQTTETSHQQEEPTRAHTINLTDNTFCLTADVVKTENKQDNAMETYLEDMGTAKKALEQAIPAQKAALPHSRPQPILNDINSPQDGTTLIVQQTAPAQTKEPNKIMQKTIALATPAGSITTSIKDKQARAVQKQRAAQMLNQQIAQINKLLGHDAYKNAVSQNLNTLSRLFDLMKTTQNTFAQVHVTAYADLQREKERASSNLEEAMQKIKQVFLAKQTEAANLKKVTQELNQQIYKATALLPSGIYKNPGYKDISGIQAFLERIDGAQTALDQVDVNAYPELQRKKEATLSDLEGATQILKNRIQAIRTQQIEDARIKASEEEYEKLTAQLKEAQTKSQAIDKGIQEHNESVTKLMARLDAAEKKYSNVLENH